jgi:3-deoxy-D-manno-octulosonic-acid transferase
MMSVLLDVAYLLALVLSCPFWLYRMIRHGRYRRGASQRLGAVPIRYGLQPIIWVYGVSLGEIKAAQTLVAELHSQLPDFRVVISSWTDTGLTEARHLFEPDHLVFARPLDFGFVVRRALNRLRPDLVVLVEGDVWPNFLAACNRRNIPVVVVNGRMSQNKGYPRYKMLGGLATRLFNRLTAIGVQDEAYAERFRSLGVQADKIQITGMMKFDREVGDRVEGQEALAAAMGITPGEELIVAGGTGEGEEKIVLEVFEQVRKKHPQARLAIVPRKPERFDEVAKLIQSAGFELVRRSQHPDEDQGLRSISSAKSASVPDFHPSAESASVPNFPVGAPSSEKTGQTPISNSEIGLSPHFPSAVAQPPSAVSVILGDTMGELRKFYALARCVFVGRSLVPAGGSDMIESAALGKPTAFGPHTFNFPQAADLEKNGCARVADAAALAATLDQWLTDPAAAARHGREAQEFIRRQQGATRRNVEMICRVLGRTPAATPGGIATDQLEVAKGAKSGD